MREQGSTTPTLIFQARVTEFEPGSVSSKVSEVFLEGSDMIQFILYFACKIEDSQWLRSSLGYQVGDCCLNPSQKGGGLEMEVQDLTGMLGVISRAVQCSRWRGITGDTVGVVLSS
jgi:hypothetical protein